MNTDISRQNYAAWNIAPLSALPSSREAFLKHLIGWAILAANTHNAQPWKFIIHPKSGRIYFCLDPPWVLPASDKEGRQSVISLGCALENFLCAADYYGTPCEVYYPLELEGYPLPLITVQVGTPFNVARRNPDLMNVMRERRMNRNSFNSGREVPPSVIEAIRVAANSFGTTVDTITDWLSRTTIANIQYKADQVVIATTKFRNELGRFFLPNDTDATRGMPGATYGLNDEMARRLHQALQKEGPFDPFLANAFPAGDLEALRSASLIAIVSVPEDTPRFWIATGRTLQRAALIAENENLGMSVHAAMVEVSAFNVVLKARLRRSERPTAIFRLGYPEKQERPPHSPRVPVEEVAEVKD